VSAQCNSSARHECRGWNSWRDPPPHPHMISLTCYSAFCFDDSAFQDGTSRSSRNVGQRGVAAHKSEHFVPTDIKILKIVSLDGHFPNRLCSRSSVLKILRLTIHIGRQQSHYGPEVPRGFQEVKVPMAQNGGKVVGLTHRPFFTPRKYFRYSCLLETESTPGDRKDYANKKFKWHHLESNQRPSGL